MSQIVERYFVVPHTHWDREWYRPLEHFQLMLGSVVDEVLETLESDPTFASFTLDGQAIVLEDYVAVRPENEPRLRALIAAERIEVGPSYVLPDEFLVGGEPLVRNLLIGRAVCERFGGQPSPAGYLPDSFGHPLQLPQILAGFGIETFLFSRGLGDEVDELGVAFNWVAPDGSAVLALQLLADYSNFANIAGADDAEGRVRGLLERFGPDLARADVHQVVLCNGTDHWRVQPEMPAVCDELERRFPGSAFGISKYGDFVSTLRTAELPSWNGELLGSRLWNVLRGVNSARLYLKQANERAEQRLVSVETLAALSTLRTGRPFPLEDVTFAWQALLKCHPHDSICGCSCDEVHRDMLARYASLHRTLDLLSARALAEFPQLEHSGRIGLINPLPFARSGLLSVDGAEPQHVDLAPFEARTVELAPAAPATPRPGDRIESDRFRVAVAGDGTLVVDDLKRSRRFEGLHALEDELDMGDLYNFCPVDRTGAWRCADAAARVRADGPLCSELEVSYRCERPAGLDHQLRERSETAALTLTTVVRLARGVDRIEFETTVDNPIAGPSAPSRISGRRCRRGLFARKGNSRSFGARSSRPSRGRQWCEPPDATQHAIGIVALGPIALMTRGLPEYEARRRDGATELCLTLLRCVGIHLASLERDLDAPARGRTSSGPRRRGSASGVTFSNTHCASTQTSSTTSPYSVHLRTLRCPFVVVTSAVAFASPLATRGGRRVLLPEGCRGRGRARAARVQPRRPSDDGTRARPRVGRARAPR